MLHYQLKEGDSLKVTAFSKIFGEKTEYEFVNTGTYSDYFIISRARRKQICGLCFGEIPKGQKYFGHDNCEQHHTDPKFCFKCAIDLFKGHKLQEITFDLTKPFDQQIVVLREVEITEILG